MGSYARFEHYLTTLEVETCPEFCPPSPVSGPLCSAWLATTADSDPSSSSHPPLRALRGSARHQRGQPACTVPGIIARPKCRCQAQAHTAPASLTWTPGRVLTLRYLFHRANRAVPPTTDTASSGTDTEAGDEDRGEGVFTLEYCQPSNTFPELLHQLHLIHLALRARNF